MEKIAQELHEISDQIGSDIYEKTVLAMETASDIKEKHRETLEELKERQQQALDELKEKQLQALDELKEKMNCFRNVAMLSKNIWKISGKPPATLRTGSTSVNSPKICATAQWSSRKI